MYFKNRYEFLKKSIIFGLNNPIFTAIPVKTSDLKKKLYKKYKKHLFNLKLIHIDKNQSKKIYYYLRVYKQICLNIFFDALYLHSF